MDSTYKINMYMMPWFEIVEVTSTNMTYSVAFAFLMVEKEEKFDGETRRRDQFDGCL